MRDRALEKVKAAVFIGSNAAFLGCLMCRLNFRWSTEVKTAGVSDTTFLWNPDWFDSLTKEERKGVLLHELWHIALLHGLRVGSRDPKKWNIACVAKNTLITMADGSKKPIESIKPGEYILSCENKPSLVYYHHNNGKRSIIEIQTNDGKVLKCTPDHKVLTKNGYKTAESLEIGEEVFVE